MVKKAIIELQYMPPIPTIAAWYYFDEVIIESYESFSKQSYRNRCEIYTANSINNLIVPVQQGNSNIKIREIRIDNKQSWAKNHWRSILSAYGKAPFFEHYGSDLEEILNKKFQFLFDLNLEILSFLNKIINPNILLNFTEDYQKSYPEEFTDLRSLIHPKKRPFTLEFYQTVEYIQVFGNQFVGDLSIIDLIFCEGPNSEYILKNSIGPLKNN